MSPIQSTPSEAPSTVEKKKGFKSIKIELSRKDGTTWFEFAIDPNIENIFKKQAQEIRKSSSWEGLEFYYCPQVIESEQYQNMLQSYNLADDFGHPLFKGKRLNIAFVRTVGGKGKIAVEGEIPFSELGISVQTFLSFLKRYHEEFLADYTIKGSIQLEL